MFTGFALQLKKHLKYAYFEYFLVLFILNFIFFQEAEGTDIVYYYYSSFDGHKRSNAAFLSASYMVLCMNKTPEEAFLPFSKMYPPLPPFRDASVGLSTMSLTVIDCLRGLVKARDCKFFDLATFDFKQFD